MSSLGTFLLLAAFVTASGAFAASLAGARRGRVSLINGGVGLCYVVAALMVAASGVILHAFVVGDYSIRFVQHDSNASQPLFYKIASYWGGLDGSILFWVALLSVFGAVAVYINRERHRLLIPWVVATISVVEMFFLFLMVIHHNPFETFLSPTPADGEGLNPLLQNFYMAIHPPMLYLGFTGMTIPFAFGIGALASGQLDDSWLRAVRRWTIVAWLFLSVGLTLGALWSYEVLGWGGYWAWDPVENAGLLPWFTATAFLHSVIVQERRGMLKVWNLSLVIMTFFLTIVGTFMTRSGVVQSMHAFGEDQQLAWMFTGFMVFTLVVSFGLLIYRLPLLRARNDLDSWVSREAAFLVNNWVLLFAAFFILFATLFPTLSEAVTGQRLTVAAPFFNRWMTPVGLILLVLTGVGPLLAWRKSSLANLWHQFVWPTVGTLVSGVGFTLLGVPFWPSGLCFAFCVFVTVTIGQEFVRGAAVRRQATGTDLFTAMVGLVARSRRRYGGYIVHLGIVLIFIGFAGNGFSRTETVLLTPGHDFAINPYNVHYQGLTVTQDGQKQMVTATTDVTRNGKPFVTLYPARWFFFGHEDEPTTQVALRRSVAEDFYLVLASYNVGTQEASFVVHVNPLVDWIWSGVGIMVVGTVIAFLPESAFAFAAVSVPEGVATTSLILLLMLSGGVTRLHAQVMTTGEDSDASYVAPKSALEKQLDDEIICMCGTCGRKRVSECLNCTEAAGERREIAALVAAGKTHDEVIQYFIRKYGGQQVLAEPIDKGFNRLAWLFPYALGFVGIVFVGGAAARWTHRHGGDGVNDAAAVSAPQALQDRLDDELREFD